MLHAEGKNTSEVPLSHIVCATVSDDIEVQRFALITDVVAVIPRYWWSLTGSLSTLFMTADMGLAGEVYNRRMATNSRNVPLLNPGVCFFEEKFLVLYALVYFLTQGFHIATDPDIVPSIPQTVNLTVRMVSSAADVDARFSEFLKAVKLIAKVPPQEKILANEPLHMGPPFPQPIRITPVYALRVRVHYEATFPEMKRLSDKYRGHGPWEATAGRYGQPVSRQGRSRTSSEFVQVAAALPMPIMAVGALFVGAGFGSWPKAVESMFPTSATFAMLTLHREEQLQAQLQLNRARRTIWHYGDLMHKSAKEAIADVSKNIGVLCLKNNLINTTRA
eukprot:GHVP01062146.1.p1 GENE.GHVP01062146.1~~GHVP01062146.1.p1  ORF type:complete len:334 (-),score=10.53 GHVP01062146.1:46-1047(-)